jgi:glycerol-3-phosphate dehydrogenase subunit B
LIVGAGLAGLITAWRAVTLGKKVKLISKGWGATHWGSGCIDVFGYSPLDPEKVVLSPEDAINELITARPNHPYALAGLSSISKAIRDLTDMFAQAGYPMHGQLDRNWMLPTALGAIRPTCLAPETMIAGDIRVEGEILISGFDQYLDFYPALVADNLVAQNIPARSVMLHLPGLEKRRFVNAMSLARLFDQAEFREEVIKGLKPELENARRVGFPAVLGLHHPLEAIKDLERQLGCAVFEIPGLPPSIPGIRMHNLLTHLIQRGGGQVYDGMQVVGKEEQGLHLQAVLTEAASGVAVHPAQTFVLATGGILGGGITLHPPGYMQNMASETAFGMPLRGTEDLGKRFQTMFLGQAGHPIFRLGVEVNSTFQPIDSQGVPLYDNLFVIGGTLAHFDPIRERSLEGVAVVTGYCIGQWMD